MFRTPADRQSLKNLITHWIESRDHSINSDLKEFLEKLELLGKLDVLYEEAKDPDEKHDWGFKYSELEDNLETELKELHTLGFSSYYM
jgi:hypothetical protein